MTTAPFNFLVYDPLEQFEMGYFYDSFFYGSFLVFSLAAFLFILLEKSLNVFIGENFIDLLIRDLIKSNLPQDFYYVYYILQPVFFFFFYANIAGLFAYGFTETATVPVVFMLSFTIFFGILFTGIDRKRNFILNSFLPQGTPDAILKLIVFIEVVSYSTRLISLALRLLANMISGHILLKILISFV
jgi:F-type H+-transporting ATPase subunit a